MDYKDLQSGQTKDNFWFKAKNELVEVLMKKACKGRRQLKILNLGAGTGEDLDILSAYGRTYVIDIDEAALSVVDSRLCEEKRVSDACSLPYEDSFFDVVVSFDVLEHIKNDHKAVSEIHRVLKKGGALVFTVPAFQFLFSSHDKILQHQRRYCKGSITDLLSQFIDLKIFFWNSLLFWPIALMRLVKRRSKPQLDHMNLPGWANALFFHVLKVDNSLIRQGVSMPVGLTMAGYGFKRKEASSP